ncbi:hypothetical protein HWV62_38666 [Athelia sp. TMB]|nr:hypothetical protein HWV62_38666 [Athelia sp. TMB]
MSSSFLIYYGSMTKGKGPASSNVEIIEISSDDDSGEDLPRQIPGSWPLTPPKITPSKPRTSRKAQTPRSRRIIQSSSSEASDSEVPLRRPLPEVIDIDSSPERTAPGPSRPSLQRPSRSAPEKMLPLYADDEPWNVDDGSILTFARKPIRRAAKPSSGTATSEDSLPSSSTRTTGRNIRWNLDPGDEPAEIPSAITPRSRKLPGTHSSPALSSAKKPRTTKKERVAEEQARREQYASELFSTLNSTIFKDQLPKETKLNWNVRLLSTAGKAKWHRSRDGVHNTEIELATKILDCDGDGSTCYRQSNAYTLFQNV